MEFMEVSGFDPEAVFSARNTGKNEPKDQGVLHNGGEDDPVEISANASTQIKELWQLFHLEVSI